MLFNHTAPSGYRIMSFPVGPLQCNCSILWDSNTKEALVIDPGGDFEKIKKEIETEGLTIKAILHTHAHFDHVGASKEIHELTGAPLLLHPDDKFLWENLKLQGQMFNIDVEALPKWNTDLHDEMELSWGEHKLKTLFTPGHSPGSCSFVIDDVLFSGDTLFQNSIGRTDLWGGDFNQISKSIKDRLYTLDTDTKVICGHGPNTLIGIEKKENSFVRT